MKVMVLHGSARRNGNTDTLAKCFLQGLEAVGTHDIRHIYAIDLHIEHCRACMQCADGRGCVIDDDMQAVYPAFRDADIVVLATPMFWGYMTSQLKTLFDRLEAIVSSDAFGNKDFVLLIGYRHYYGSMIEWLERITRFAGSRCHSIACQTYDPTTNKDVPIRQMPGQLAKARELGELIARDF